MNLPCSNCYLCSETFSVDDHPHALDQNLPDVAKFLSIHLKNDSNFYKFGVELVSGKKLDAKVIELDKTKPKLEDKCSELIELWISIVEGPKWQDLIEAASKSGFSGLATALTAELDSQTESQKEITKRAEGEHIIIKSMLAHAVATTLVKYYS